MTSITPPDHGPRYDSMGDSMRFVLSSADTDGQYTLIEDTMKPGMHAKLHLHREHAESFYVIAGSVNFTIGSQTHTATPGTTIYISPNTPHAAKADEHGTMLTLWSPGDLEGLFRDFAALTPAQASDPAIAAAISTKYDVIDLASPPIPSLLHFYDLLGAGQVQALLDLFADVPQIDMPLSGAVHGQAVMQLLTQQQQWLRERQASASFVDISISAARIVVELSLALTEGRRNITLPVALVADRRGDQISALRVYHSTWPLTGQHIERAPLLQPQQQQEPPLISAYMQALSAGAVDSINQLFSADGSVREPSGAEHTHRGPAGRLAFYQRAFASGGVRLQHCSATVDGTRCAIEYICDQWGSRPLSPQAGMAVYVWNSADQLTAVRIYDDVAPPRP